MMFDSIKTFIRRRRLRKTGSRIPTGFLPMKDIYTANVVIDVEEPGFDELKEDILAWGRATGVKVAIYFFDFRKLGKDELLLTSIQTTILKKELSWSGIPPEDKITPLTEVESDLLISLIDNGEAPIDFLTKSTKARFKIGRHSYDGHAYDLIVSGVSTENLRSDARLIFSTMTDYLNRIQS